MHDQTVWHNTPELTDQPHSDLFAKAMRGDSNLAMDWLWLATQLVDPIEQQHCLEHAYYIDPNSGEVEYSQAGLVVKLRNLVHSFLKKRVASTGQSEEQLAVNF